MSLSLGTSKGAAMPTQLELDNAVRLARIDDNVALLVASKDDHEGRLRSVEKKQWALSGVGAAVAAIISLFFSNK